MPTRSILELMRAREIGERSRDVLHELGVAPLGGNVEQRELVNADDRRAVCGVHAKRCVTAVANERELGLVAIVPGVAGGEAVTNELVSIGHVAHASERVNDVGALGGKLALTFHASPGRTAKHRRKRPSGGDAGGGGLKNLGDLRLCEGLPVAYKLRLDDVSGDGTGDEHAFAVFGVGDCVGSVGHPLYGKSHVCPSSSRVQTTS